MSDILTHGVQQLSLGEMHSGILYVSGSVSLLGNNIDGQCCLVGVTNTSVGMISLHGANTGLLYHDGTVRVIGDNEDKQCDIEE